MFSAPVSLLALLLVAVLGVSGIAKLRAPVATRSAFEQLRLPRWLSRGAAPTLLPWGELALAAALVLVPGRGFRIVAALVLLLMLAYLVLIGRAVRWPEPVRCNCFGELGLGTVTRQTVVRNALLVLAAALVAADPAPLGLIARLGGLGATGWGWLAAALLVTAVAVLVVHRPPEAEARGPLTAHAEIVEGVVDAEELDYVRAPFPHGALVRSVGEPAVPLVDLVTERAHLLVFANPGCGGCMAALAGVKDFAASNPEVAVSWVVGFDAWLEDDRLAPLPVLVDPQSTLARTFGIFPPAAVLLGADRLLAGGPVVGGEVAQFLAEVAEQLQEARDLAE